MTEVSAPQDIDGLPCMVPKPKIGRGSPVSSESETNAPTSTFSRLDQDIARISINRVHGMRYSLSRRYVVLVLHASWSKHES